MKKLSIKILSLAVIAASLIFTSCKKEVGPQGEPGVDGNANVIQISFGSKTITSGGFIELTLPGITKEIAEKSMILTYGQNGGLWYQLPGFGLNGTREFRTYFEASDPNSLLTIRMITTGAGSETFSAIRVIVIPANNLVNGRLSQPPYDINNYESVRSYFNLPK